MEAMNNITLANVTNVTLASDDEHQNDAPRLQRQCKNRKIVDYNCDMEDFEEASANNVNDLLLKEDYLMHPSVQNIGMDSDLNLSKQYKRLIDSCERDIFKIHEKEPGCTNKNIKGTSIDKRMLYVEFNAGMFEAIKKNFVRVLKEHFETTISEKPKVETFGEMKAEERILLDLTMSVKKKQYDLKVIIFNTKCSLNVIAKGNTPQKKMRTLEDFTAGEYFARVIMPRVVEYLSAQLDISAMNDLCRKQALMGQKLAKSNICIHCEKENKDNNFFKCKTCENVLHVKMCALKYIGKDSFDVAKEDHKNYICDKCSYGSDDYKKIDNFEKDIERLTVLHVSEIETDDPVVTLEELSDAHVSVSREGSTNEQDSISKEGDVPLVESDDMDDGQQPSVSIDGEVPLGGSDEIDDEQHSISKETNDDQVRNSNSVDAEDLNIEESPASKESSNQQDSVHNAKEAVQASCIHCDQLSAQKLLLEEKLALSQAAYNDTKINLETSDSKLAKLAKLANNCANI